MVAASSSAGTAKSRFSATRSRSSSGRSGLASSQPAEREALHRLADPEGADGLLVARAPGIDVGTDEQRIVGGQRDARGALGEEVPELVAPLDAVLAGEAVQRLGTHRPVLPGTQEGILDLGPRRAEQHLAFAAAKQRVVDLFVPPTHLGPAPVPLERVLRITGVVVALGQVEDRARVVGIARDLGQQQVAIALVLLGVQVAPAQPSGVDVVVALQACIGGRRVADRVLVDDTFIPPRQPAAKDLLAPVAEVGPVPQRVAVGRQAAEIQRAHDHVVGIHDPDVVAVAARQLQRLGAVMPEVAPLAFMQLARDSERAHVCADRLLGPVVGPGVDDHPRGDVGRHGVEDLVHDVRLVADDHVQANQRALGHGPDATRWFARTANRSDVRCGHLSL